MRPKNAKPAIAHALPKIHKEFFNIPEFRPIIATKQTSHSLAGKYLVGLLYLLTTSEFSLKDSFDAANRIKAMPYLFKNGYQYVYFEVESLLTNILIKQTVKIMLKRIY